MNKHKYVRAKLILKPTSAAAAKMEKVKARILGPLTGTLVVTGWQSWEEDWVAGRKRATGASQIKVTGWLKPKPTPTKSRKTKARRAPKQK